MAIKRTGRAILLGLVAVAVVVAAGAWIMRGRIAVGLIGEVMARNLTGDAVAALPDGLHVGLCGTGSPLPDPTRNGPCTLVIAGTHMFVVDAGESAAKGVSLMGFAPGRLDAAFLTHFHSDHIDGLGAMLLQHWGAGAAQAPLPVYGPTGVVSVVQGFMDAYELDRGYRIAHHGPKVMPPSGFGAEPRAFEVAPTGETLLIDEPDLKVTAFAVVHGPVKPAVGYKFVYKGRSVVVSGDTAPSANLAAASKGVDVLVHEGLAPNLVAMQEEVARKAGRENIAAVFHDIPNYHTSPEQAAKIAQDAGVRYLLFTHVIPAMPLKALEGPFLGKARSIFTGRLHVGRDGDFLTLPAGDQDIRLSNRAAMKR